MNRTALILLALAILSEVVGTTALKLSDGFSRWLPSTITVIGYGAAFYLLSLCLKDLGVGFTYALWSGVGIVLITLVGVVFFNERTDLAGIVGMGLIIAGVVVLNFHSQMGK